MVNIVGSSQRLISFLFDEVKVLDWEKKYVDNSVRDGTEWCLGFTFSDGSQLGINGSNAYPPMFERVEAKFEDIFRTMIFDKAEISEQKKYLKIFSDVSGISACLKKGRTQT